MTGIPKKHIDNQVFWHNRCLVAPTTIAVSLPSSNQVAASAPPCVAPNLDSTSERWFQEQVQPHGSLLKSYLKGAFPSVRDIDDVVQESYLRIWKAKAAQPIASAKAFLFKVARHIAVDLVRRNRRSLVDSVSNFDSLNVIEDRATADASVRLQEKINLLTDAFASLPARRREIIVLRKLKRLPQKEVAEMLGISERTVENLLFRGIKQCQAYLHARGLRSFTDEI